ncbi:MAG: hypothetical protein ACFFBD_02200, partial [Candidatus Hodarchaeota archaeon]
RLWLYWYIPLAFICIANNFHFWFAQELLTSESGRTRALLGLATVLALSILTLGGIVELGFIKFLVVLSLVLPVYFYIMWNCYQAWNQSSSPDIIRRFQIIFLSVGALGLIFVFFLFDILTGDYTIFFYLAWFMGFVSALLAYYAYVPTTKR